MTKIQTAALCLALAVLPLGYQWHALGSARALKDQTAAQLQRLRSDVFAREREQARAEHRLSSAQNALAKVTAAKPVRQDENLYVWDENSPYIRVPKDLLSQLRFAPFGTRLGRDGKAELYQLPPFAADGSPQPALTAALGLSTDETDRLRTLCQSEFAQFNELAASHSQITEQPFAGTTPSATLNTSAFPDEGAQFRDQFKEQVVALLGSERAAAFWQQAAPEFSQLFNDFGANSRQLQLIDNPRGLELMNASSTGATIGPLSQRNGLPLPPQLQAYADAWSAPPAGQANAQSSQ